MLKTLSIYSTALLLSLASFGSLPTIQGKPNRSPALEKVAPSLKLSVSRYLVAVAK